MIFGEWLLLAGLIVTADLSEELPIVPLTTPPVLGTGHTVPPAEDPPIYETYPLDHHSELASEQWEQWTWQDLPDGLMYRTYIAGVKEPRFSSAYLYDPNRGWFWDSTLGGRVGIVRYGTKEAANPVGWQLDIEGAVFARLRPEERDDLESSDYRFGIPLTHSDGRTAWKFGYYHISSHLGDEFMLKNPGYPRLNYVRDSLLFGVSHEVTPEIRTYGELGWAIISHDGGAKPWEIQFGAEYQRQAPEPLKPAPFAAIHTHLREEFGFGGNVNILAGWSWLGEESGRAFRIGMQYFNGKSAQYSFYNKTDRLLGAGLWFDY